MRNGLPYQMMWRTALLGTALATIGFAQMGGRGGVMGSGVSGTGTSGIGMPGTGTGISGGMGLGLQGTMAGAGGGIGSMASGPVIGADGTAYVMRITAVGSGTQQAWKRELVAINPSNGKANWSLQIDGTMISEPVFAKDGMIYLTTSEPPMGLNTTAKPALIIVAPTATSARVQARVTLDGDILSAPVITPDGQTIYVTSTDMPDRSKGNPNMPALKRVLYGLASGTGAVKFTVPLQ